MSTFERIRPHAYMRRSFDIRKESITDDGSPLESAISESSPIEAVEGFQISSRFNNSKVLHEEKWSSVLPDLQKYLDVLNKQVILMWRQEEEHDPMRQHFIGLPTHSDFGLLRVEIMRRRRILMLSSLNIVNFMSVLVEESAVIVISSSGISQAPAITMLESSLGGLIHAFIFVLSLSSCICS